MNYQTPPSGDPATMVKAPAIAMLITTAVSMAIRGVILLLNLLGTGLAAAAGGREGIANMVSGAMGVITAIIALILGGVIIMGSLKMMKLQNHKMAMTAAVLCMIPCVSPCCPLTIAFGIWAMVVLNKPEVKAAFTG
jgi:hypothetical protein